MDCADLDREYALALNFDQRGQTRLILARHSLKYVPEQSS